MHIIIVICHYYTYVMNLKGSQRAPSHGEMFHVTSMHSHVWAMLSSALHVLYRFRSFLPAVHCGYKLWAEYAAPYCPRRWPAGGQRRCLTPVLEDCKPERRYTHTSFIEKLNRGRQSASWKWERRYTHHRAFTIFLLRYLALVCTNAFRLLNPVSNSVFHFCESIWAEIFYNYNAYYSYYDNCANAHNVLQLS